MKVKVLVIKRSVLTHFIDLSNLLNLYEAFQFTHIPNKFWDINYQLENVISELKEFYIKNYLPKNNKLWEIIEHTLLKCELIEMEINAPKDVVSIQFYKIIRKMNFPEHEEFNKVGNFFLIKDGVVYIKETKNVYHLCKIISKEFIQVNTDFFELQENI